MRDTWDVDRIAEVTLDATGYAGTLVDAFDLAACCGLVVRWRRGPAHIMGRVVYVDPTRSTEQQHEDVAHEVAHALLAAYGVRDDEGTTHALAAVLLGAGVDVSASASNCVSAASGSSWPPPT